LTCCQSSRTRAKAWASHPVWK